MLIIILIANLIIIDLIININLNDNKEKGY